MALDEVWAWADKFSERVHRASEIRRLRAAINARGCGGCRHWMTKQCPREVHSNQTGMYSGPSSGAPVCGLFVSTKSSAEMIDAWKAELAKLENPDDR